MYFLKRTNLYIYFPKHTIIFINEYLSQRSSLFWTIPKIIQSALAVLRGSHDSISCDSPASSYYQLSPLEEPWGFPFEWTLAGELRRAIIRSTSALGDLRQDPESRQIAGQVLTRRTVEAGQSTLRPSVHLSLARTEEEEEKNEYAVEEEKTF